MAIGDTLNQNPFGKDYNAEEEKKKQDLLAAQNAMMGAGSPTVVGAGNIPASAFGQAPAVAPFSMEAAGQVNPMMEQQSIPTESVSNLITDNPFIATGGTPTTAQPNVNFNAFSAADQANPAFKDMSAAEILNKFNEPGYTTPPLVEPTFSERPKSRFRGFVDPIIDEFTSAGQDAVSAAKVGYQYFSDPSKPTLQSLTDQEQQNRPNSLANLQAQNEESIRRGEAFLSQDGTTQAPPGASALGATPSVTPTIETPSEGAQEQGQSIQQGAPGSAQANFATRMATGEALTPQEIQDAQAFAASMGTTFDPATGYSREAFENAQTTQAQAATAPAGGLTTVGGASLSEFLSGQAMPEQGFTQAERPLGGRGVTLTPDQMNELSAEREARLDARLPGDQSVSDRDRRAARGDDISMADQTFMAKANARDATPTEVARGNQVANALGVDLETGQPLQATGGLTFDQVMKMEEFDFKQGQEAYKREQDDLVAQGKVTEAFEKDSALLRQVSGDAGRIGRLTNEAIGITTEPGTTALSGSLLKHVAGSDANQLKSILEVISSKVALDRLMEVKKTGATLGQVSEKELAMLQNSYDALQQSLPPERLREALTNYANQLKKVEDQTQRAFINKHGQDKFNKIMGGGSMGQGEPRYSNDQNVGVSADTYYKPSK